MKGTREQVLADLQGMLQPDQLITREDLLREYDSENGAYAKAYGVYRAPLPLCIANATSKEEIARVLRYCNENGVAVIPRTGQSGYEGLLTAVTGDCIVLDGSQVNRILKIDYENMMATCECGVPLALLEETLQREGYTTGHSPQSLPVAQMGGLVATRSTGQFSTYYGGIEDLLCGLEAVLPDGRSVRIRNVPRRASGPDLRHFFLGSEGALGYITEVTVKIFRYYPDTFFKAGYIVPDMQTGFGTIRDILAAGYRPSVVRLYDKADYDHNFGRLELDDGEAFMFFVAEGPPGIARATGEGIEGISLARGARPVGPDPVEHWLIHRNDLCDQFQSPELRESYRETKVYYSTTEISASYTEIGTIYDRVIGALSSRFENITFVGGHASHAYQNGINIYFVCEFRVNSPETFAEEHQAIIDAICEEVLKLDTGGCVHHHGMGKHRVKFAPREHGSSYVLMEDLKAMMDPKGIMNPGTLVLWEGPDKP